MKDFAEYIQNKDIRFRYMLLSRMQSDCAYYLGNGRIFGGHLWAKNEKDQIKCMKLIWNSFQGDQKPEWISYDDILAYERRLDPRYKVQQDTLDKIARHLNLWLCRPKTHLIPEDNNTVYFYNMNDCQENHTMIRSAFHDKPISIYDISKESAHEYPLFVFDNSDEYSVFSYQYACNGQFDLKDEQWNCRLFHHLKKTLCIRSDCEDMR